MNTLRHFLSMAALPGFAVVLAAQAPTPTAEASPGTALHRAVGLAEDGQGGFRAIAMRYKASLHAAHVEFTPMLGERAPHNLPLRLRTTEIRRGATMLHEAQPIAPTATGNVVRYERGACDETYAVTPEGLKLSYEFAAPLAGDGDLVVRCHWASELLPRQSGADAVDFLWPEIGGVRVDTVVGIDATGARATGEVRLAGDVLEFVLPDAFVDAAHYPLVLDPLVGASFLLAGSGNTTSSDIAIEPVSGISLVVFQARASSVDIDVFAQRVSNGGNLLGSLLNIDSTTAITRRPRVGCVSPVSRFLVVWQQSVSLFGPHDIRGVAVDVGTGSVSAAVDIAATPDNEFDPAVGGEASPADDDALVVWCTATELRSAQVNLPVTGAPLAFGSAPIGASPDFRRPAISKACGADGRFLVAWEQLGEIRVQYMTRNQVLLGPSLSLSGAASVDTAPCVDGGNNSFLVGWEREEVAHPGKRDVVCSRVVFGTSGLAIATPPTTIGSEANIDDCEPDVAWMGERFALVFAKKQGIVSDDVWAVLVNPDCTTCNTQDQLPGASALHEGSPRIAPRYVGLPSNDDAFISFTESDELPPFSSDIRVQRFTALSTGQAPVNLLGGCALGGTNGFTGGGFVIGNGNFTLQVTGADPGALLFLSLGLPSGGLICGACTFTNPLALDLKPNVGGSASSLFALPCNPTLIGFSMETQWLSLGTGFTPCPLLGGASASNRLQFTLGN